MGGTSRVPFTYFGYIDNVRVGTGRKSRMHPMVVAVPLNTMVFRTGLIAWWVLGLWGVILLGGEMDMQYLYNDGEEWHFMEPNSFEQYVANEAAVAEAKLWLKEQDTCVVTLWDNNPMLVTPPNFVTLEVTDTDPGLKGDTSGSGGKPATLETGAVVRVPLFVQIGEKIKVDTRSGEYVSRAKES